VLMTIMDVDGGFKERGKKVGISSLSKNWVIQARAGER